MKKVLLTGASGFIGRHCVRALSEKGYAVHTVSSRQTDSGEARGAVCHQADLLDRAQAFRLMETVQPTHLLHLAWYAVPGKYWTSTENFRWVQSSLDLFQAFAHNGGQRIVAAGTCAEYEWGLDAPCSENETPLKPATLYGACKHALRIMLEAYAAQEGLSVAWGRIFFLYGPRENPGRFVASVIRSLLLNEAARCSHGRQMRDLLHVADVADAFVALLDTNVRGAVNIASGRPVTLRDVAHEIGRKLNRRELIELGAVAPPANEPLSLLADVRRLSEQVGWKPSRDLSDGLDETIAWWRRHLDSSAKASDDFV